MPCLIPKSLAPFPHKKTWLLFIITSVASSIGLRTFLIPEIAPAAKSFPLIIAASIS